MHSNHNDEFSNPKKIFYYFSKSLDNPIPKIALEALDNPIPKIALEAFKSVEYIEGSGEPRSIKKVTFGEGSQFKYMKEKVEALDKENFVYACNMIEGDVLINKPEKITYETKLEASPDGGFVYKTSSKYYTIGDFELNEEGIKAGKENALGMFKAIEAYLYFY